MPAALTLLLLLAECLLLWLLLLWLERDATRSLMFAASALTVFSLPPFFFCRKLEEELHIQSIGIESLLDRYKKQNSKLEIAQRNVNLAKTEESMRLTQLKTLKQARLTSEARVHHLQTNVERLNDLRAEYEKTKSQLVEKNELYVQEKKKSTKETVRAEKWKARAFDLSKQMLELTTIQPMKEKSLMGEETSGATPQSTDRNGGNKNNSSMWSASVNQDWRGGISSVATLQSRDPPNMRRVQNQGPGQTTVLRPKINKNYQSLPVLNPANGGGSARRRK